MIKLKTGEEQVCYISIYIRWNEYFVFFFL